MSVIAWDGKSVAADKQATNATLRFTTTKLRQLGDGTVLGWTGEQSCGEALAAWYADGAIREKWPAFQAEKDGWCRLIVISATGVLVYEQQPFPVPVEDPFMAWGAGRDFAMGALACGASASDAVKVASRFDTSCGMGVDEVRLG